MKRFFRRENILIFIAVGILVYAFFLNIFFPISSSSSTGYGLSEKEETGLKADFKNGVSRFVDEEVAGLSFGYLLGEKSELPSGVEEKMKAVGLAHIIVVSGTHLSIIIGASRKIFEKISRFASLYFSLFLLGFYIILIGISPSIVRASFVAVLSIFAWYFGREQKTWRTIILTLGFCLALNPYYLTSVSFQLSMLAYSGVVIILPIFIRYFYGRDRPGFIGSTILSSLSAIIACLPIQLYYFGTLNFVALMANLLILPTIPYAMGATFLTGIFAMLHLDFLAIGLGQIIEMILSYHIKVISRLYDKSEFMFEVSKNNPIWLAFYALIFLAVIFMWKKYVKIGDNNATSRNKTAILGYEVQDTTAERIEWKNATDKAGAERENSDCENGGANNSNEDW